MNTLALADKLPDIVGANNVIAIRRKNLRDRPEIPQGIRIRTDSERGSRTLAAKLADAAETGVGVDTRRPLRVGSIVVVEGKLHHRSYSFSLEVEGQARVIHARSLGDGVYRVGLAFQGVVYRRPS